MTTKRLSLVAVALLLPALAAGCGHSEDEWQAKLKELEGVNAKLAKTSADKKKCDDDLAKAQDDNASLKADLDAVRGKAGDLSKLSGEQASLIERLKREKEQLDAIRARFDQLKKKLNQLTALGLNVTVRNNQMVIQLPGDVLFASGRTDLQAKGKDMLLKVADVISKDAGLASRHYQVAGHTDNKVYAGPFKDNWGLSLMRAREVHAFLTAPHDGKDPGGGLNVLNWAASGYGETDPIVPNDSPENMAKNRRVELVVMPNVEEMLDITKLTQ